MISKKLAIILLAAISLAFSVKPKTTSKQLVSEEAGFAVVELFTSEGCSSCPPADALLAKIEKENQNKPVYLLAYHVDYWDRLGWKDRFSSPKFSARQAKYANWLKLQSIYTPEIVVNGTKEFIGSEENTLRKSITTALSSIAKGNLQINLIKQDDQSITISFQCNLNTKGNDLVVAIINPKATNQILKGENKGKTLSHIQIVNQFESFSLDGRTTDALKITYLKPKTSTVNLIVFLQDKKTGKIMAATKLNAERITS